MEKGKDKNEIRRDWKYRIVMGLLKGVARLPLGILYGVSDFARFILQDIVGYRKKVIRSNLRRAFPEATDTEIRRWMRGFYQHLCDVIIEAVKLAHISDEEVDRRIEIVGAEKVNDSIAEGRSVVLLLGHYGNWEWVTSICRKFTSDAYTCQIYHPLSDKVFDEVMLTLRGRFGSECIPMSATVRKLLSVERSGRKFVCGFIADQRPFGKTLNHWTEFMGIDTPYVVGGESIGEHVGSTYLYVDVEKKRRGYYRLTFRDIVPPIDDTDEYPYTRQYLRMLEDSIRRAPQYWLWSHNRWSRTRTTDENVAGISISAHE